MKSEAYLNEIREEAGLKRAVLKKITVEGQVAVFHLVTDLVYSKEDLSHAEEVSRRYVPDGMTARAEIVKSVPSAEGVRAAIADILKTKYPAAAALVVPAEIETAVDRTGGRFVLTVPGSEKERFERGEIVDRLAQELSRCMCGAWVGSCRFVDRQDEIEREAPPPMEFVRAPRVFPVERYEAIDGADPKTALFIADLKGERQDVTVCGTVVEIEERVSKKENPYFSVTVSDGSGRLRATYFAKKATLEKVRAIAPGDGICLSGNYELYNGNFGFKARKIDRGYPPEHLVFSELPSRPVPATYVAVRPEPVSDPVQGDLFGTSPLPARVLGEKYVVFDLETTGLNHTGSNMDRIIEVGAVKIEGGEIREKFSTFVACPVKLSAEIVDLTGITDEMLAGAPDIKDVIADFYKFCEGCSLVAHNIAFDGAFIRYYGGEEGFRFDHPQFDTVALAQKALILPNYKLNTVADHFGFTFRHHRAFDDAFVTAKIFLELARENRKKPA